MVYDSITQAVGATGVPRAHFKTAKSMGAPGLRNHRIYWEEFGPWYETNKREIQSRLRTKEKPPQNNLKAFKLIREIIDYDLIIAEKRKQAMNPAEVYAFLAKLGESQRLLLNDWKQGYAARVAGKSETECAVIMEQAINDLLSRFKSIKP